MNLSVCLSDEEVNADHDDDREWNAEVTNDTSDLRNNIGGTMVNDIGTTYFVAKELKRMKKLLYW